MKTMSVIAALLSALVIGTGCASDRTQKAAPEDEGAAFIAMMDAKPAEELLPDWDRTKALMSRKAPAVGDSAPDFVLPREDGLGNVRLSGLWPEKPVVLVFGSYT